VNDFETTAALIGISNGYDHVICGHIHKPIIKTIKGEDGQITYMNSGDWIENLTALEYNHGSWTLYRYEEDDVLKLFKLEPDHSMELSSQQMLIELIEEFSFKRA
jgi:predicted phosphodiesterase